MILIHAALAQATSTPIVSPQASTIISIIPNWAVYLGLGVLGLFAAWGIFDKARQYRKKQSDAADDRLIDLLQKTVDKLTGDVGEYKKEVHDLREEVDAVKKENAGLREILQGRDKDTVQFQADMRVGMGSINKNIENLVATLDKHLGQD